MILTCPTCASRYFVDDAKLGPLGRTVRCANCGGSWRAEPEAELLELGAGEDSEANEAATSADAIPKSFREQAEAKRQKRAAVAAGVAWAGLAASLAVLVLVVVVFRVQVVRLWPRTAGAYAAVRLPVNPLGLAPDDIQAGQGLENGQAALVVTGAERNVEARPRAPAPVRVSLFDKAGARLESRLVRLSPEPIPAGESRAFTVSFLNPPLSGVQVGVDFLVEAPPRPNHRGTSARPATLAANTRPGLDAAVDERPRLRVAPQAAQPVDPGPPYGATGATNPRTH